MTDFRTLEFSSWMLWWKMIRNFTAYSHPTTRRLLAELHALGAVQIPTTAELSPACLRREALADDISDVSMSKKFVFLFFISVAASFLVGDLYMRSIHIIYIYIHIFVFWNETSFFFKCPILNDVLIGDF